MSDIPTTEQFWGTDSYLARAFPLNSDGSLQAPSTAVYEGLDVDGTRDFNITPAEGTVVANIGNGRLRDTIYRAPRDPSRAELTVGYTTPTVKAALSAVETYLVGEMRFLGRLTNKQGSEPDVAFLVTQRGHNENGLTRFRTYLIPKSRVIPRDSSFNDNASQEVYQVTMSNSRKQIWGKSFTVNEHGFTDVTYEEVISEKPPKIVAWLANTIETEYLFPTDKPASSTGKIAVYNFNTGLEYITGVTKTVLGLEFDYPPNDLIVAVYEYDES